MSISTHQGPLTPKDPNYDGSAWILLVNWEDGSTAYEPLNMIAKDAPDMCARYGLDNNLLAFDGCKKLCRRAKTKKLLELKTNQAKKQQSRYTPVYRYGVEIPRDSSHAREIDKANP